MKTNKIFWILLAVLIVATLVLAAIYLFNESIWAIDQVYLSENGKTLLGLPEVINLPFTLYRGWDVIAIVIYTLLFSITFRQRGGGYTNAIISFPLGATAGFIFGAISVTEANNLIVGLVICLLAGIILSTVLSIISKKDFGIYFALGFCLISGLMFGLKNMLTIGVALGLIISLIFTIITGLFVFLTYVLKPLFKKNEDGKNVEVEEI